MLIWKGGGVCFFFGSFFFKEMSLITKLSLLCILKKPQAFSFEGYMLSVRVVLFN